MRSVNSAIRAAEVRPDETSPDMISPDVAPVTADEPVRSPNLFTVMLRKELADHLHGRRFVAGAIICMLLCSIAAVVRLQDYRQAHQERSLFLQRWQPSVREQVERDEIIEVENTRAVSP